MQAQTQCFILFADEFLVQCANPICSLAAKRYFATFVFCIYLEIALI